MVFSIEKSEGKGSNGYRYKQSMNNKITLHLLPFPGVKKHTPDARLLINLK